MGIGKQAKTLNKSQIEMLRGILRSKRNGLRNETIFLLSTKSGLRAKEISLLSWKMVLKSDGTIDDYINLPNSSSKGRSGRIIPLHKNIKQNLEIMLEKQKNMYRFDQNKSFVIRTERSISTTSQAIVNMFYNWYRKFGLLGCSSHSGRRTFITDTSKKISLVGGSLRDIQMMVGHSSLQTTQRYIKQIVNLRRRLLI